MIEKKKEFHEIRISWIESGLFNKIKARAKKEKRKLGNELLHLAEKQIEQEENQKVKLQK